VSKNKQRIKLNTTNFTVSTYYEGISTNKIKFVLNFFLSLSNEQEWCVFCGTSAKCDSHEVPVAQN
jgi:hypothetical protein